MGLNAASAGRLAVTTLEPIGPVLAFSAFNHPLNLIVHQVGPAIAVGCPVVIKPAESTPLSCLRFVQILREAGLPDEWCQPLVYRDHSLSERLAADPPSRLLQLHRQRKRRLASALEARPRHALRTGARRSSAGRRGRRRRSGRCRAAPRQGRLLPCRPGLRLACSESLPIVASPPTLAERLAASATKLRVGDPTLASNRSRPAHSALRSDARRRVGRRSSRRGGKKLCGGRRSQKPPTRRRSCSTRRTMSASARTKSSVRSSASTRTTNSKMPSAAQTHSPTPSKPPSSRATSIPRSPPPAVSTPAPS